MKYRILIRAFTLRRDVASSLVLKHIIEKGGECDVYVASMMDFEWILKKWKPHAVIVNTIGQIKKVKKLFPQSSIFYQAAEGMELFEYSDGYNFRKHEGTYDLVDGVFIWGQQAKDYFKKAMPNCDMSKLHIVGNHRLDMVKFNPDLVGKSKNSKSIGFVGRFSQINDRDGKPTIHYLMSDYNLPRTMRELISYDVMMRMAERILEETDYTISFRPYPLEATHTYEEYIKPVLGDRFVIDDSLSFTEWAAQQKYIVSHISTTFTDAYLFRIPIVSIDKIVDSYGSENKWDGYVSQDAGFLPETLDKAMDIIKGDGDPIKPVDTVEENLRVYNTYYTPNSALQLSATIILKSLKAKNKADHPKFGLPTTVVRTRNSLAYLKNKYKRPHITNFHYHPHFHKTPSSVTDTAENILHGRYWFPEDIEQ